MTIMTTLTDAQRQYLDTVLKKRSAEPERFWAGDIAAIMIDGMGAVSLRGDPFLGDMDQLTASKLIKAIARCTDLHPDAIADFMDDLTEGMEPKK